MNRGLIIAVIGFMMVGCRDVPIEENEDFETSSEYQEFRGSGEGYLSTDVRDDRGRGGTLMDVCVAPAQKVENNGHWSLPIDQEYAHLPYIGQVFTAAECSSDRVEEIDGVENGRYMRGIRLILSKPPSAELQKLFSEFHYHGQLLLLPESSLRANLIEKCFDPWPYRSALPLLEQ